MIEFTQIFAVQRLVLDSRINEMMGNVIQYTIRRFVYINNDPTWADFCCILDSVFLILHDVPKAEVKCGYGSWLAIIL